MGFCAVGSRGTHGRERDSTRRRAAAEPALGATRAPGHPARFAGGLPWEPAPEPGEFASRAPVVLPERARTPSPTELEQLGRRTASIAHDFNNLLSVILVCAGEIAAGATGAQRERAEEIREAAMRGAALSRGLLAEERAVGSTVAPPLAVDEAILGSMKLIERALAPAIRLTFTADEALPRVALAAADLERILLNLAANAHDAMPDGGSVAVRAGLVSIPPADACLGTGWHVRITFADTGAGMSPEVARRALDPYFSTKSGDRSRGIGLASARSLIRAAGGDLRINSQPGCGTTISLYLPALDSAGKPLALPGARA